MDAFFIDGGDTVYAKSVKWNKSAKLEIFSDTYNT